MRVLHRPRKQGLGPAYIAGFRLALSEGAALVIEMDADFSHDPALPAGDDRGARATPTWCSARATCRAAAVRNWGAARRLVSRGGCWYARVVLGLDVRDLTGGFKCFRREVLEAIDLEPVRSQGYAFQVELTYRAIQSGFRVKEVPITFTDRRVGQSKMSKRIVLEAMWMVPTLRAGKRRYT